MEVTYFLVIMWCANQTAWGCSVTTIPKPLTEEACVAAGKAVTNNFISFRCIGVR